MYTEEDWEKLNRAIKGCEESQEALIRIRCDLRGFVKGQIQQHLLKDLHEAIRATEDLRLQLEDLALNEVAKKVKGTHLYLIANEP